jgi:hypothetical protein
MLDIINESFTICKIIKKERFSAVGTFWFALLDPCPETMLTGEFTTGRAHTGLAYILKADVAL